MALRYDHPDDYWDVDLVDTPEWWEQDAEREVEYVHDPDDYERPGNDTHTNNLRGGYA